MDKTPKLNKALCDAQLAMENPKFDSQNPHFRSKFASLRSVREAVLPVLAGHGIAVVQELVTDNGGIGCITHLLHDSGEEKSFGPYVVHPTKMDPQAQSSASTYARRYQLQSVACVVGEQDDDGNAASERVKEMPEKQAREIAHLLDSADLENGEGVDAFGEAWIELNQDEQLTFAPWVPKFYPGGVSKAKEKMRAVMLAYRNRKNEVAA
jgi:hypothetical protein